MPCQDFSSNHQKLSTPVTPAPCVAFFPSPSAERVNNRGVFEDLWRDFFLSLCCAPFLSPCTLKIDFQSWFSGCWKQTPAHLLSRASFLLQLGQGFDFRGLLRFLLAYTPVLWGVIVFLLAYTPVLFYLLHLSTEVVWPLLSYSQPNLLGRDGLLGLYRCDSECLLTASSSDFVLL